MPVAMAGLGDGDQPINIQSARMMVDNVKRVSVFEGNVMMRQGSIKIDANKVEVSQDGRGHVTAKAWGKPVHFEAQSAKTGKRIKGRSSMVEYEEKSESVTLIGDAWVVSEGDEIKAHSIRYLKKTGEYRADSAKGGGPVFVTIAPRKKTTNPPKATPAESH